MSFCENVINLSNLSFHSVLWLFSVEYLGFWFLRIATSLFIRYIRFVSTCVLNVQKPPLFSHHISIHNAGATWAATRDSITHPLRHFLWRFLLFSWLHVLMSINPVKLSTALSVSGSDITKAFSLFLPQSSLWRESSRPGRPVFLSRWWS